MSSTSEFARYTRDYAVRSCASAAETSAALRSLVAEGAPIPLLVTESALPDSEIFPAIAEWRSIVPTARRRCRRPTCPPRCRASSPPATCAEAP